MSIILRVGAVKPLRNQDTQYGSGSGDEAGASYTDADVLDIPLPEHTYQRPLPAVFTQPQNNTSYFGLPYHDHNYGLPPPQSPPRPPTPDLPPSPLQVNGVVQMEEEVKTSPMVSVVEEVVEDSITRCICGYLHDDGYMICCDKCSVWQHIDCMGVDRNDIPDNYFCELCQPRILDAVRAKALQKRKREELAARNVLSDSSATDTDPEEAANAMASMVKKLPVTKRKGLKQRRNAKTKEKTPLKLKIGKAAVGLQKKIKKAGKKEKENIKAIKSKKVFKSGVRKFKELKSRPLVATEQSNTDPWDSHASPWVDPYEVIRDNSYSDGVLALTNDKVHLFTSREFPTFLPTQLQAQLVCVADVKKNRKGLKAVENILAGRGIIEYTGKVMLKHEYDQQVPLYKAATLLQPFVLFHSRANIIFSVDATQSGNDSRFIRRSCAPNAEVQLQYGDRKIHFVVLAKKEIDSGAEVTIPFDYDYHISNTCIECACLRTNCVISRFWKKKKKSQQKEHAGKRRRQSSGGDSKQKSPDHLQKVSSPQSSPRKIPSSPGKAPDVKSPSATTPTKIGSPIRLSVSTLLAASALLEAQSESTASSDFKDCLNNDVSYQPPSSYTKTASSPLPKSATSLRRGSKLVEEIKDDKSNTALSSTSVTVPKEKAPKAKEPKIKVKENKELQSPVPTEVKRERRLSSRRQSQEDVIEEKPQIKEETTQSQENNDKEDASEENYRKMTREERKLDAIMKAFEKMEKREERRKEAIARGDGSTKKPEQKGKKKDENESDVESRTRSISQEDMVDDEVKVEVEEPQQGKSSSVSDDNKMETSSPPPPPPPASSPAPSSQLSDFPVKDELSSQKHPRKIGKRKRRRSRVQTAPPLTDPLPPSQDESSMSSSNAQIPPYIPPAPASAPVPATVESMDTSGEEFKYIKTKKHLFNEWSHKHEDESSKQEEMFVECLPSPRVNAMDHLQRRNSHSAGCHRAVESSGGGFAKKRWLRQAMHEEPAPVAFNHSLSVSTESGSASPIYGNISPNNVVNMASPGASSPIDFVTPLKKRRLMRESLSTEGSGSAAVYSPGPGVLASEPVAAMDVVSKSNGLKSFLPSHRLSVDDRLLLHKSYPLQNGFKEEPSTHSSGLFKKTTDSTPSSVSVCLKFDSAQSKSEDAESVPAALRNGFGHKVSDITTASSSSLPLSSNHLVNGFVSNSDCITSVSLSPSRPSQRASFETMEVNSSGEGASNNGPSSCPSKVFNPEDNGVSSLTSINCNANKPDHQEESESSSSSSVSRRVHVVNSVYNGVNNLMESSSEAGYVVTKSIMEADGPATVCVDLNVHEMEPPTSLAGGTSKTVVNLDKEIFSLDAGQKQEQQQSLSETHSDCQVNSSEDLSLTNTNNFVPSLRRQGKEAEASNCDNIPVSNSAAKSHENVDESTLPSQIINHQLSTRENSLDPEERECNRSLEARSTIDEEARSTTDEEALSTVDEEACSTIDEARSTTDEEARSTIDEARSTIDEARSTIDEARLTVDEEARSTIDESASSVPTVSNELSTDCPETISSSSHTNIITSDSRTTECDSAEALQDIQAEADFEKTPPVVATGSSVSESSVSTAYCDSGSSELPIRNSSELKLSSEHHHRSCDSAGNNIPGDFPVSSDDEVMSDYANPSTTDTVTESCIPGQEPISHAGDANVDSTSSESTVRERFSAVSQPSSSSGNVTEAADLGNDISFCDSNSERDLRNRNIEPRNENSISVDESSNEEIGVSSSSTLRAQPHNSDVTLDWEEEDDQCSESSITREAVPDNASMSYLSPSPVVSVYLSPGGGSGSVVSSNSGTGNVINVNAANSSTSSVLDSSQNEDCSSSSAINALDVDNNSRLSICSGSGVVSSDIVSTTPPPSVSPHSGAIVSSLSSPPVSSMLSSPDESSATSSTVSTSSKILSSLSDRDCMMPTTTSSPSVSPSSASTSSEATPATKKKVSLLEYRKRLKKPATTCETKASSSSSPVSLPCTTVTLSSVCEKFLSSSPSSSTVGSFSSSTSSSATSPHRRPSGGSSSGKMPTLATLPLFKSTENKKEEKRPPREKEKKKVKQLSLSDRLRLEFGLDDSAEDNKNKPDPSTAAVDSSSSKDESIPPPPPPPRHPPPFRSYPYSSSKTLLRPTSSFPAVSPAAASTIPSASYAAPLVNGSVGGTNHPSLLPQQPGISSTSVSLSHNARENSTSYPTPPHPHIPPYQQPPSSISSSSSTHQPWLQSHHHHHPVAAPSPVFPPGSSSSLPASSNNTQPSSTSSLPPPSHSHHPPPPHHHHHHHPPHHNYNNEYFHNAPSSQQSQQHAIVSGNTIAEDEPPPPPPPLPRTHPPSHHNTSLSSSSSSSSSRRSNSTSSSSSLSLSSSHRRHDSSDRNKKAASSSSSSSSSSLSHHSDKRGRY